MILTVNSRHLVICSLCFLVHFSLSAQQKTSITFHKPENPARASAPFSEAVQVGNTFYLAGQIGMDRSVNKLAPGGIQGQTEQTIKISKAYSSTTA